DAGRAAAPRGRARVGGRAVGPLGAADHVVAVAQGRHAAAAAADRVIRGTADQAVRGTDGTADAGRAAAPRDRARRGGRAVGPVGAADHVVAVAQGRHAAACFFVAAADRVIRRTADQAVRGTDGTADAGRAAAPRDRARTGGRAVGPVGAGHHVVAVAQGRHAGAADLVIHRTADQAVRGTDGAADAGRAAAP